MHEDNGAVHFQIDLGADTWGEWVLCHLKNGVEVEVLADGQSVKIRAPKEEWEVMLPDPQRDWVDIPESPLQFRVVGTDALGKVRFRKKPEVD